MTRRRFNQPEDHRRRGFTIVELLVATAITAVMAALLITITTGVMSVWNRSRGSLTTSNQVKIALDQLATDLEGALFRSDGGVWFAATILETNNGAATTTSTELQSMRGWIVTGTGSSRIKPESDPGSSKFDARNLVLDARAIGGCSFGQAGVWLRFFAVQPGSNNGTSSISAPVALGYQICRRRVGSGGDDTIAYMLFRAQVRPTKTATNPGTFEVGYDVTAPSYSAADAGSLGQPSNLLKPRIEQALALNVVDFGVRLYIRESNALRLIFPAQPASVDPLSLVGVASDSASTGLRSEELSHLVTSNPDLYSSSDPYRHVRPDVAEIMIRVLTDEGAARLGAYEAGTIDGDWWDIVLAHSRVYTRRVEIRGGAL